MATTIPTEDGAARTQALSERLFQDAISTMELFCVYLGDRLGLYRAMAGNGGVTAPELAGKLGLTERYVREWLEQQAVAGVLHVDDHEAEHHQRRYHLPDGHDVVLTHTDSLDFLGWLPQLAAGTVFPIQRVLEAFQHGGGVSFADYGADMREGQEGQNRNLFRYQLGDEYLPSIPDLHARLLAHPPARIADLGCGVGWSSVGMARAYPSVLVDGFDLDEASVRDAQAVIAQSGLGDRVTISLRDAADPVLAGRYDLVTAFECVHDMSDPVGALATMRRLAGDHGTVLVVDERVAELFDPNAGETERLFYGFSVLHCLPVGMADKPSAGTGAVMRPSTLREYALEAGFRELEILPIENPSFYFYRLLQ